ncbi:MAG: hypothetical protein JJU46_12395 [Balneolaceae bacterium]|nr:hypothetical protein [Balneolaceae bacterium]MCH8549402.1 hypothetical protein [Balneolaceae bacterium]
MKKQLITIIGVLCLNGLTVAQNPSEVFIQQANVEHNEAVKQFTGDFILAFSGQMSLSSFDQFDTDGNVAFVNQFGDGNVSTLIQNGIGNMARINIMGNRNVTGLEQDGNSNRFILNLEGSDNEITGSQIGNENEFRMDFVGDGISIQDQSFVQSGNNLTLQLFNNGNGGGVPLQIEQRGNGASVIIENY